MFTSFVILHKRITQMINYVNTVITPFFMNYSIRKLSKMSC
jgi:hypothetical protein